MLSRCLIFTLVSLNMLISFILIKMSVVFYMATGQMYQLCMASFIRNLAQNVVERVP